MNNKLVVLISLAVFCITGLGESSLHAVPLCKEKHPNMDPAIKAQLLELAKGRDAGSSKTSLMRAVGDCCNVTEAGTLCQTQPFTEIRQSDIPLWITCPGTYKIVENLFYDGDTDPNNPNPAASFYGPIGIGINAPGVILDMDEYTFTYKGFATNAIMTYDTLDLSGNYIAQAHGVTIKNGRIIGNLDDFSAGLALLSSDAVVSNVSSELSDYGLAVDSFAFVLDEQNQAVDLRAFPVNGIIFDRCYAALNNNGISSFDRGPVAQMRIFDSTCDQNGTGVNAAGYLTMDNCTVSNSLRDGVNAAGYLTMDNCSISNSLQNGVDASGICSMDNCTIDHSGTNGFYGGATLNIRNSSIQTSGTNGLVIVGADNVLVSNTQINESGADGLIVGIRHGNNVDLDHVQVFNAGGILLRVDDVYNFKADDCQFTNFLQNPLPNNSPANPIVRIQDAFNATLSNSQISSNSGTSDGCLIRNSQGVTCDACYINITSTESADFPSGFVLQGDVSASCIKNCSVTGRFAQGIALTRNELNGINKGIVLENNIIEGATDNGIFISEATNSVLLENIVARNQGNGITLAATSSSSQVRNNTLMHNAKVGLSNEGCNNQIFSNFANNNCKNFDGVALVSKPSKCVGVLSNISSK